MPSYSIFQEFGPDRSRPIRHSMGSKLGNFQQIEFPQFQHSHVVSKSKESVAHSFVLLCDANAPEMKPLSRNSPPSIKPRQNSNGLTSMRPCYNPRISAFHSLNGGGDDGGGHPVITLRGPIYILRMSPLS